MIFRRAQVRLAVMIGIAEVVAFSAFALAVYLWVAATFDYDQSSPEGNFTAEAGFAALRTGLLLATGAVAVLAPASGYVLAGLALAPARRSYESQQRFIDDASHELRTPLSAIRTDLELAVSRPRSPLEHRALAERALASSRRMSATLGDLLWLSRGELPPGRHRSISVRELTLEARALLPPDQATRTRIIVDPGLRVVVEPNLVMRALSNLLQNGLRYSADPVVVTAIASRRNVWVLVDDRGRGMTPGEVSKAFEPFWRGRPSSDDGGSGLGLAIARRCLRLGGGSVSISSAVGVGTRAIVTLPRST